MNLVHAISSRSIFTISSSDISHYWPGRESYLVVFQIQPNLNFHKGGRKSNLVVLEILLVESPIGVSTKVNLVEIPSGVSTVLKSNCSFYWKNFKFYQIRVSTMTNICHLYDDHYQRNIRCR